MDKSLRAPRVGLASAALLAAVALTACGTATSGSGGPSAGSTAASSSGPAASGGATSAAASTPAAAASSAAAAPASAAGSTSAGTVPSGGPVPSGFAARSVTFVSADEAFVLGTAPCAKAPCTSILRTQDRGASWRGLPAPVVPLAAPLEVTGPAVWGIRFASPSDGFVFGNGLWETTDGGAHWAPAVAPGGPIESLEVIDGQILAITSDCSPGFGCGGQTGTLERRPLAGGSWQKVGTVSGNATIATQARVAAVLDGSRVTVTTNGGINAVTRSTPCTELGTNEAAALAVTGPSGLALLCGGNGAVGSVDKTVYASDDLGAHWTEAGSPARGGDPEAISAGSASQLVVAAASGASMLYYSADGGAQWITAYGKGDGGLGFNDLGFTTAVDGVVVYGPVQSDGNVEGRPGRLLLTGNGGASWQAVSF